jgi:hypothetical protein
MKRYSTKRADLKALRDEAKFGANFVLPTFAQKEQRR